MLKPLYDYALRYQLTPPPGMVKKTVKAWVSLSENGIFLGGRMDGQEEHDCPNIGSLAQGKDKCNLLVEKSSIVFSAEPSPKHQFFVDTLRQAAREVPPLSVCLRVFDDEACLEQVRQEMTRLKIKPGDRVSFEIGGVPIMDMPAVRIWWQGFRQRFIQHDGVESLCLITGEPTIPVATIPPVKGLLRVGGQGSGTVLFCFDKAAFCSYGLKQSANAPVSAEAIEAVNAALDHLMSDYKLSPVLAGMRFVHWFDCDVPAAQDPVRQAVDGDAATRLERDPEDEDLDEPEDTPSDPDAGRSLPAQRIESIETGEAAVPIPAGAQYYILLMSGVKTWVMVRSYDHGNYHMLEQNIQHWRNDLQMVNLSGTGRAPIHSLKAMLIRLMPMRKNERNVFERLDKELPGITSAVLQAILGDRMLPDSVAVRALRYIRSQMVSASEDDLHAPVPDAMCCQWLKAWLLRKNNNRRNGVMDAMYNPNNPNIAYRCGAWVAVYASMQQFAMRDVKAGVVQRYYASACQMPALVLGQLSMRSVPHQDKIKGCYREMYQQALDRVTEGIEEIPAILNLEQQAYFALGYRQMTAELNAKLQQLRELRKENDSAMKDNDSMIDDDEEE